MSGVPRSPLQALDVLVVEDEIIIYLMIEDMLTGLGVGAIRHAARVGDALSLIEQRKPDLALLDVNLGGEYAYEIAERLKARAVPLAFMTGYGTDHLPSKWSTYPVLQKPFDVQTLASRLASALGG